MKKIIVSLAMLVALFIGYLAAGPYITVAAIKTGIAENDAEKMSENIEFPTLRQNIKEQLNASMMKKSGVAMQDNPFAALAVGLAAQVVDGMVDSFVTPSGLAAIMEGKQPVKDAPSRDQTPPPEKDDLFKNARFSYDSSSQFSVWVPNEQGKETRFILERRGLSWKLVNLILPK
ncbi:Protein of unknown function [Allopseudospirillum japonicum]|uniref:DUF2939 domain-containing protein n=2 Tax=Allopseudospirillum japonicum TaxID=64971 RepID=A0A1H6T4J4_9GAMM|nr:Protein of unknown function [Allopseudospirillum japonicum]